MAGRGERATNMMRRLGQGSHRQPRLIVDEAPGGSAPHAARASPESPSPPLASRAGGGRRCAPPTGAAGALSARWRHNHLVARRSPRRKNLNGLLSGNPSSKYRATTAAVAARRRLPSTISGRRSWPGRTARPSRATRLMPSAIRPARISRSPVSTRRPRWTLTSLRLPTAISWSCTSSSSLPPTWTYATREFRRRGTR